MEVIISFIMLFLIAAYLIFGFFYMIDGCVTTIEEFYTHRIYSVGRILTFIFFLPFSVITTTVMTFAFIVITVDSLIEGDRRVVNNLRCSRRIKSIFKIRKIGDCRRYD